MSRNASVAELAALHESGKLVKPRISDAARSCLGPAAEFLDRIGLPVQVADSFKALKEVLPFLQVERRTYTFGGKEIVIRLAVEIGRTDFGSHVVDCETGCIVYADSSGATQLINTSLDRFLYFAGRFKQSADGGFSDADSLLANCKDADPEPLTNPEGMWSVMIEEAQAGLY